MNLPSQSVEAGSSLSTKQRVAAGIPPPPTGPKPLPTAPKKSLPALSFKKIKQVVPPSIQDTTMPSTSAAAPASPVVLTMDTVEDGNMVASPQPMDVDQHIGGWSPISDGAGPPIGRYVV